METQELGSIVPEIIEILEGLEPAYDPPPSVITSTDFNKTDTETRQIVSRFLKENPALRGNREVSIVRRTILREANQGTISLESVGDRLLERLSELL